jgi:alkanesulfonate monooxygenase SsuD/methylene tetrahydromethanopterin reductase-like flavin-dependent oxidoreductase (luciferase family)
MDAWYSVSAAAICPVSSSNWGSLTRRFRSARQPWKRPLGSSALGSRGETVTFAGTHHRADGAVLRPPPVQQPYIPLLIAGGGERTALRYVAQYADMSSMAGASWAGGAYTPTDAGHKFQVLQRRCEEAGRPYGSILRSTLFSPLILAETPAAIQAKLDQFPKTLLPSMEQTAVATTPGERSSGYRRWSTWASSISSVPSLGATSKPSIYWHSR